jgi:hypothetical protein
MLQEKKKEKKRARESSPYQNPDQQAQRCRLAGLLPIKYKMTTTQEVSFSS